MVVINAYNGFSLDMSAKQLPASAADLSSLQVDEFTNSHLFYWVDIAGTTIGAEFTGSQFLTNTDPPVTEFNMFDSSGNHMFHISEFNYKYSEFASLLSKKIGNPKLLAGDDDIFGDSGKDVLTGYRGSDYLEGQRGDDIIRAGNGRDEIWGGLGSDELYGGFGKNTFYEEDDGRVDKIYFKSDQLAYNYIYGKAGNSPNGQKADTIYELDSFDQIYVQGATNSQLGFSRVSGGIGIFADEVLEATYIGSNLNLRQIATITSGIPA